MAAFRTAFLGYLVVTYPTQLPSHILTARLSNLLRTLLLVNLLQRFLVLTDILLSLEKVNFFSEVKEKVNELYDKNR